MLAHIVLIKHPKVPLGPFRALHFAWRGRPYFVTLHNVGAGRSAWGYMDGIKVVGTCEAVVIPLDYVEDVAKYVDSIPDYEGRTRSFLKENSEWFRVPDPKPSMLVTPSAEETRATLARERGFGSRD